MSIVVMREVNPLLESMAFAKMMRLVRQGNQEAAAKLVRHYEPKIHRAIRRLIAHHCLSRDLDAHDISQVVLAKFFVRNLAARCELTHADQLANLLIRMAKNRVRDEVRKVHARRRDRRRLETAPAEGFLDTAANRECPPVKVVAGRELVVEIYRRLSDEERRLAELRSRGLAWTAIANHHGESAEALRKKLARAIIRVRQQLSI